MVQSVFEFILKVSSGVESETGLSAGQSSSSTPSQIMSSRSSVYKGTVMLEQGLSSSEGKL